MILLGVLDLFSCSKSSTTPANVVLFQTDFTNVQLVPSPNYIGFNPSHLDIPASLASDCSIGFAGEHPTYANAEIVSDNDRNVLRGSLFGDDPNVGGVTRFQMDIIPASNLNLSVYHFSHRMFLNSDLAYLSQFPNAINEFGADDWTILFEMWNQFNPDWDGDASGSCRWDLSLAKEAGTSNMFWVLSGEYMQPAASQFKKLWDPLSNKTVSVPFGKWFTLDFYMKRGDGTNGQLIVSIQLDGGTKQVLFNTRQSTIYPAHPELKMEHISPFKLYMSPTLMDFMSGNGKNMDVMYNDFKWYQN